MSDGDSRNRPRSDGPAIAVGAFVVVAALALVVASLRRPELEAFAPTPVRPVEVGRGLTGPTTYTVDATQERWVYFDFSRASVVPAPTGTAWDLAFRRHTIIANGGSGFAGRGGILYTTVPFDTLVAAPAEGYLANRVRGDTVNPAIEDWYDYSWTSHVLRPKPGAYVVRTADGKYAKMAVLSYYCPEARSGCVTFRFVYQGDGTRRLSADSSSGSSPHSR